MHHSRISQAPLAGGIPEAKAAELVWILHMGLFVVTGQLQSGTLW